MDADLDKLLDGDEPSGDWLNHHDPPRARHQSDDELMLDSEPTPQQPRFLSSNLMQSAGNSNSQLSPPLPEVEAELEQLKPQSPFATMSSAPTSTDKQESSNNLYEADSPALASPEATKPNGEKMHQSPHSSTHGCRR